MISVSKAKDTIDSLTIVNDLRPDFSVFISLCVLRPQTGRKMSSASSAG